MINLIRLNKLKPRFDQLDIKSAMFFIGTGALLRQALNNCAALGIIVDGVCCPTTDHLVPKYKKLSKNIILSDNPNNNRSDIEKITKDGVVFSINNKHILSDEILKSDLRFYNIHNGLVQKYRGIAEVCIFAAICHGVQEYGVTLQRMLPGERVDGGAVLNQISTPLSEYDDFEKVFANALNLCNEIFKLNVIKVLDDSIAPTQVWLSPRTYSFKDIPDLIKEAPLNSLARAKSLGYYAALLPRLKEAIERVKM